MSNTELVPFEGSAPPAANNTPLRESASGLPRRSHILVLGNTWSGASDLYLAIKNEVAARAVSPEDVIEFSKDGLGVTETIYGITDRQYRRDHAAASETSETMPELLAAQPEEEVLLSIDERPKSVPLGIVVFDAMRDYSGSAPGNMSTPYGTIEALATEHNIPVVYAKRLTPEEIGPSIGHMLTPLPEPTTNDLTIEES